MGEVDFNSLAHWIKSFSDTVMGPLVLVLIPAVITGYFKLSKGLDKIKERIKKGWTEKLKDFDAELSRRILREIGFFIDGVHSGPYCRADQIIYLGIENGIVGPSSLHSMFISSQAESTGIASRCSSKMATVQRIPYNEMSRWCDAIEENKILRIADIPNSPFKDLKIHADAGSAIVVPVYTKEDWLAGMVVFNYFDKDFNHQENTHKCEELIHSIKAFVEGQFIHKEVAHQNWIDTHS